MLPAFDDGTEDFQPTNLEITSIDVGNSATNVIRGQGDRAVQRALQRHAGASRRCRRKSTSALDQGKPFGASIATTSREPVVFDLAWRDRPSEVFLTRNEKLIETLSGSIEAVTGRRPALSTSGGTSDARFIKDFCPVVEFGLVGKTMHMVDERVPIAELEALTQIYGRFLEDWFG